MKPGEFRSCPACATRNKPKWEFCVKCGESLQGVSLGVVPEVVEVEREPSRGLAWLATVVVAAALIGAGVYMAQNPLETARPSSELFTIGTVPPQLPPAVPGRPESASSAAYKNGRAALARGDLPEAVRLLREAVSGEPENALYHHTLAQALWQSAGEGRTEALTHYERAARLSADVALFASDYARALAATGLTADAIAEYRRVLDARPDSVADIQALARILNSSGNPREALDLLQRAAALRPDDLVLRQDLGYALEKAGNIEGAAKTYSEVLERMPRATVTRGLLAELLFKQGRKEEAIAVFREGVKVDPEAPLVHRGLGSLLERTGKVQEAIAEYREYTRLAPNAPDAKQLQERADRLQRQVASSS